MDKKRPARGGFGLVYYLELNYGAFMEFTDFMLWKAGALVVLAGIYGFYQGFTDRNREEDRSEAAKDAPAPADRQPD